MLTNKETAAGLSRIVFDVLLAMKKGMGVDREGSRLRRRGEEEARDLQDQAATNLA